VAQASIDEDKGTVVRFSGARARASGPDAYNRPMQERSAEPEATSDAVAFDPDEVALRALISAIGARDESALTALYDATASRVMGLALRFTGEHDAAEEVVMDVYLQVWRQWDRYSRARGKVMAWIFTICRSRALDWLRRRDPAETHADPYALGIEPCTDSDPLDALVGLEARGRMAKALRGLTRVERQLLSMAFFRGLTHEEIARCTQAPLGSVKTVIRNAMQKLKRSLETQADFAD
jgi:RNA polymerase sigma factor (sigma-70 family)